MRAVVPGERLAQPLVHADVEVEHDEDGRLQPVGEVEGLRGELEAFARVLGEEEHVLGVAMGGVGAGEDVRLLRAGRHAGRRAAALDVEDDRRDLGEIGEADELLHQRDAGAGGRGEGAGAVPGGADHHADRGELVLGLDDGVAVLAGRPDRRGNFAAVLAEGLRQRGRRRDRIPGRDRRAAIDAAEAAASLPSMKMRSPTASARRDA